MLFSDYMMKYSVSKKELRLFAILSQLEECGLHELSNKFINKLNVLKYRVNHLATKKQLVFLNAHFSQLIEEGRLLLECSIPRSLIQRYYYEQYSGRCSYAYNHSDLDTSIFETIAMHEDGSLEDIDLELITKGCAGEGFWINCMTGETGYGEM